MFLGYRQPAAFHDCWKGHGFECALPLGVLLEEWSSESISEISLITSWLNLFLTVYLIERERLPFSYQAKTLDHDVKHAACGTGQPHSDMNPEKSTAEIKLLQRPVVYTLWCDGKNCMLWCKGIFSWWTTYKIEFETMLWNWKYMFHKSSLSVWLFWS